VLTRCAALRSDALTKSIEFFRCCVYPAPRNVSCWRASSLWQRPPARPGNNTPFGHAVLDLTTTRPSGVGIFSDGTGKFTHFNATISVTSLNPPARSWNWDGQLSFQPY